MCLTKQRLVAKRDAETRQGARSTLNLEGGEVELATANAEAEESA